MKYDSHFHVRVEDHLGALRLDENQRNEKMDILVDADVLEDKDGETYISIQAYTEFILSMLDQIASSAGGLQSFDELKGYESLTRGVLHEWAIIIGNISHHIARDHRFESIDEIGKGLEGLIDDMRAMFEHLVEANKLFMQFGRVPGDGSTGEQA